VRQQADDAAALIDALGASPAIVIGRSYGADVAIELALRHPGRVRALALLEGGESLSEGGRRWLGELEELVLAAADAGPDAVAEALLRRVLGDATWEGLPGPAREMFTANGPAIVAEFRGGFLDAGPDELAAIAQPTLLVAADDSPPAFAEATAALASAIPSARVARVPGGHLIDPAGPDILAFIDEVLAAPG
jgi:pimeloyl-ACP methyl ester carboxylesterase